MAAKRTRGRKTKRARAAGRAAFLKGALAGAGLIAGLVALTLAIVMHERQPPRPRLAMLPYEEPMPESAAVRPPAPTWAAPSKAQPGAAAPRGPEGMAAIQPQEGPAGRGAPEKVPAWQRFAMAAQAESGKPMIAIVIDDVGVDRARSARAVELPGPVTLSFLPYAHDLAQQAQAAHAAGHELLVHVPMEPESAAFDPGPEALLTRLPAAENLRRLRDDLSRFSGYVGINNHMGSLFTADRAAMDPVMEEVKRRGLLFVDSKTTPRSVSDELARELGVPYADRQVFLDNDPSVGEVHARLLETERIARENGYALAIGHPHDGTLEALAEWIPAARARGFALVPVSSIVRHRLTAGGLLASSPAPPVRARN
jgi:polysaccharide deacetylase 2 family uncharacterized protein YibQ